MVDIRNDERIYGPSMSILKGKSKRIKPRPVMNDKIQIPRKIYKNNSIIKLCIDVVYINFVEYLVYLLLLILLTSICVPIACSIMG